MSEVVGVADNGNDGNVVGAPLPQDMAEYKPMLAGFGPEKIVTVFNPLPSDFRFQHARSMVQQAPLTKNQQFAEEKGLSMRKDSNSVAHYSQYWILKSGEHKNLPGDIAQKAVQDLVNYILMSRAGKGQPKNVADGHARAVVEREVVIAIHDNVAFMNDTIAPEKAAENEVAALNPIPEKVVANEPNTTSRKATSKA